MKIALALVSFGAACTAVLAISQASPARATTPRPAAWAQCSGCHSVEPGRHLFGPSLAGLNGRRAGTLGNYAYSPALRASDLVWTRETLDRWIAAPQSTVPGTRMPFRGVADANARRQLVDYLLSN